jgi:acetyl esterase/lipase
MTLLAPLLLALPLIAADPDAVVLWPEGAPGSQGRNRAEAVRLAPTGDRVVSGVHAPSITPYLPAPASATGAAILIAPGGGHRELWTDHEGHNVAKYLAGKGIAGFVLKYRLAREKDSTYRVEVESLADTQRAMRLIRSRAKEWGVDPNRVGVMGFSAGGELAALVSARPGSGLVDAPDPIDRIDAVPAFQVLVYPAIPRDLKLWAEMPPALLICGENDRVNISQGLPELYVAMKKAGMSAELHVYAGVGHGFGLRASNQGPSAEWLVRTVEWMGAKGWLKR